MLTLRRKIDVNGQYSNAANGSMVRDASQMSHVLLALRTEYGTCPVAPTFGNKSAPRAKPSSLTKATKYRTEADCKDALAHLTRAGLIWNLAVTSTVDGSAMYTRVEFTDASGDQDLTL